MSNSGEQKVQFADPDEISSQMEGLYSPTGGGVEANGEGREVEVSASYSRSNELRMCVLVTPTGSAGISVHRSSLPDPKSFLRPSI